MMWFILLYLSVGFLFKMWLWWIDDYEVEISYDDKNLDDEVKIIDVIIFMIFWPYIIYLVIRAVNILNRKEGMITDDDIDRVIDNLVKKDWPN